MFKSPVQATPMAPVTPPIQAAPAHATKTRAVHEPKPHEPAKPHSPEHPSHREPAPSA